MVPGALRFLIQAPPAQRRTLLAAALGWMLDAFDAMLFALVLAYLMRDLGMSKSKAGLLQTLTLIASGLGGMVFGFIADGIGRKRALIISILTYSLCSFASGLARSVAGLAFFRFILGLGMGGEWNTGATLVAETWPSELRAKAMSVVQSSWAIGYALAALVAGIILHFADWRMVFFVGGFPALLTLWILAQVPESVMWQQHRRTGGASGLPRRDPESTFAEIFTPAYRKHSLVLLLVNFLGLSAWWGLFTWIPPYLSLPVDQGGRGLGVIGTTTLLVVLNLFGMFPGYLSFGWIADHLGRRRAFLLYLVAAACTVPLYAAVRSARALLVVGAVVAFFGTGVFSGSGIIASEIFPTRVRARALGFTYNGARGLSSVAPLVIGSVGEAKGLSWAFYLSAGAYLLAALVATQLPETKGKSLE